MNKLSALALVISCVALMNVFVVQKTQQKFTPKPNTYEQVQKTETIRCGYTPYSVALLKDKAGNLQGIYKDMMDEVGKLLDLKIEWTEEIIKGEQIAGLNAGRYDMVCSPTNMTGSHARAADFVTPFYYSPVNGDTKTNLNRANIMLIKSNEPAWKAMINNAIMILQANGTIDTILDKWKQNTNSFTNAPRVK